MTPKSCLLDIIAYPEPDQIPHAHSLRPGSPSLRFTDFTADRRRKRRRHDSLPQFDRSALVATYGLMQSALQLGMAVRSDPRRFDPSIPTVDAFIRIEGPA